MFIIIILVLIIYEKSKHISVMNLKGLLAFVIWIAYLLLNMWLIKDIEFVPFIIYFLLIVE